MKTLLIVESPHKAKTVSAMARPAIQGPVFAWACLGHLRDLPDDDLGININGEIAPEYVIPKRQRKTVEALREKIAQADIVLLATDPDREGEAVAWHVTQVFRDELQGKVVRRVSFSEITPRAVQKAIHTPRDLDMQQVAAAVARRVLDRLIGWHISPILWAGMPGERHLSAGRVQSAALRLLVQHEQSQTVSKVIWNVDVDF